MKKLFLLTILVIVSFVTTNLYAETVYQKEVNRIVQKYYSINTYGYERTLSYSESMQLAFISPDLLLLSIYYEHPNLAERMANELKEADKLKTDEDYFREWKNSDHGKLTLLIKDKMGDKYEKDEFETQAQYQERVKNEMKEAFVEWCTKVYAEMEKTFEIHISPKKYNAETQMYTLEVKETFSVFQKSFSNSFEVSIKIIPQYARSLSECKIAANNITKKEWYVVDNNIYANVQTHLSSGLELSLMKEGTSKPLCFEFKKLQYDVPSLNNYKWCYTEADKLYNYWDGELQKEVTKYNKRYIEYPFNVNKETLDIHLNKQNRFDGMALKREYNNKIGELDQILKTKKTDLRNNLRFKDTKRYIEIYEQLDSNMQTIVSQMAEDYRCYNLTEQELKLAYIDNRKPAPKTCKEKYIHLFRNEEVFEEYYSSNRFQEEVAKREKIYSEYLSCLKFVSAHSDEKIQFKSCKDLQQGYAKTMVEYIDKTEIDIINPSYETDLLEKYFSLDVNMTKEYTKNGAFFPSKRAFFDSYTSSSYKADLKNVKNKK